MGKITEKQLEENLQKIIASEVSESNESDKKEYEKLLKQLVPRDIEKYSISSLDEYYEEGITKNDSLYADDIMAASIGYALLTRYGLEYDEYVEWANKQNDRFQYSLLSLVGIDDHAAESKRDKIHYNERISYQKETVGYLKNKKKLITYTDENTGFTLFGKNIKIDPVAKEIGELLSAVNSAIKNAENLFWKQYESKCTDYKAVYSNIIRVYEDAFESAWVKVKRYLRTKGVDDASQQLIYSKYREAADVSQLKEAFDECFEKLENALDKAGEYVADRDADRRSGEFVGGGIGLGGFVKGMVTAGIMNAATNAYANAQMKGDVNKIRNNTQKTLEEIFCGEEARKSYSDTLNECLKSLLNSSLDILYPDKIEKPYSHTAVKNGFTKEFLGQLSDDEYKDLLAELFITYPFTKDAYIVPSKLFCGVSTELAVIQQYLIDDKDIHDIVTTSKKMVEDDNNVVFTNLIINHTIDNSLILDGFHYGNQYVRIEFPNNPNVFGEIKNRKWDYSTPGFVDKFYLDNSFTGINMSCSGGFLSYDDFKNILLQTDDESVRYIKSIPNYVVENSAENIQVKIDDAYTYKTFLAKCKFITGNEKHDCYLMLYFCNGFYANITIANLHHASEPELLTRIGQILEKTKITSSDVFNTEYFGKTASEVAYRVGMKRLQVSEQYWIDPTHIPELSFNVEFRKNVKVLLTGSKYEKYKVFKYDYEFKKNNARSFVFASSSKAQYVLYSSKLILLTDNYLTVFMKQPETFLVSQLIEIYLIKDYFTGLSSYFCVRFLNGETKYIKIDEELDYDEIMFIAEVVNLSLHDLVSDKISQYYFESKRNDKKEVAYCKNCEKLAYVVREDTLLFNKAHCSNCNAEKSYLYKIKAPKDINFSVRLLNENKAKYLNIQKDENELIKKYNISEYKKASNNKDNSEIMAQIRSYVKDQNGRIDYRFASVIRTLYKYYISRLSPDDSAIINTYDLLIEQNSLYKKILLENEKGFIGQYVLYASDGVVITDFNIYFFTNKSSYVFEIIDIVEIIPMCKGYEGGVTGLSVRYGESEYKFIYDIPISNNTAFAIDILNIVLENVTSYSNGIVNRTYYYKNRKNKEENDFIYCPSCHKITTLKSNGKWVNHFFCSSCYNSVFPTSIYTIWSDKRIDALRKLSENFIDITQVSEMIIKEIDVDDKNQGVISLGISLHDEFQKKEKTNVEKNSAQVKKDTNPAPHKSEDSTGLDIGKDKAEEYFEYIRKYEQDTGAKLDLKFCNTFRRRIKYLMKARSSYISGINNNWIINQYDYNIKDNNIWQSLHKYNINTNYGEYFLLATNFIVLSDRKLYLPKNVHNSHENVYDLHEVHEILIFKNRNSSDKYDRCFYIRYNDPQNSSMDLTDRIFYKSSNGISSYFENLMYMIDLSLEGLNNSSEVIHYDQEDLFFCKKCFSLKIRPTLFGQGQKCVSCGNKNAVDICDGYPKDRSFIKDFRKCVKEELSSSKVGDELFTDEITHSSWIKNWQ